MHTPANGPKNAPQPRQANPAPITPPSRKASPVVQSLQVLALYAALVAVVCLLVTCSPATAQTIAQPSQPGYAAILSKPISVTPQRHCGFFAPEVCPAPQAGQIKAQWPAAPQRPQSVYDGWTCRNKTPLWGNMAGGSDWPRVAPVTLSDSQSEWANTHKQSGGHHG